ncbi:hypothetical protein [Microbacterium amylolyticum]|uniref:DUF624 domain-containing protein n=1 Tax=Microbacterium amylolyticum TaxID=936337 RepID=A0ABS4ZIC1_9MICO|nr:hypothetical protein [Microbacterium amylolyticum]MBP2437020.1 hypothetical protein [Microbacterium amylolyticum]
MARVDRALRRAATSGSGHTNDAPARHPGATGAFALFGEVLLTGVLVAVGGALIVTLPAALAAATSHLRRYVRAETSSFGQAWADFVRALPGGLVVGATSVAVAAILWVDISIGRSGALPGGGAIVAAGWVLAAVAAGALLAATGRWTADGGWKGAFRGLPRSMASDIPGAIYLIIAAGFIALAGSMLPPLVLPALGCAALAAVAIPERPRRR